jgi:DHA1 family bicyclomycin/chloramphenicol resistance-like MFS transporter
MWWRLSHRFGIDAMIAWGIVIEFVGAVLALFTAEFWFAAGPAVIFLPQMVIGYGNGILLPNSIAGAVSVRPQAAGTASGITGFSQMAVGACAAQFTGWALVGAASARPLTLTMLTVVVATAVAFWALTLRR